MCNETVTIGTSSFVCIGEHCTEGHHNFVGVDEPIPYTIPGEPRLLITYHPSLADMETLGNRLIGIGGTASLIIILGYVFGWVR